MLRSPWRSLNDSMWTAMLSAPQCTIVIVIQGIKGSLIIIGPWDMSTITPLWQQWWFPTRMLQEMMANQYILPEHPCKLLVLIKDTPPQLQWGVKFFWRPDDESSRQRHTPTHRTLLLPGLFYALWTCSSGSLSTFQGFREGTIKKACWSLVIDGTSHQYSSPRDASWTIILPPEKKSSSLGDGGAKQSSCLSHVWSLWATMQCTLCRFFW